MKFKSYRVWVKQLSRWVVTDKNINLLYAECVADYYKARGIQVRIEEM